MKICYITIDLSSFHGWGRYSRELITEIVTRGANVRVLTSTSSIPEQLSGVNEIKILPEPPQRVRDILKFLIDKPEVIRIARSCDLIHCLVEPYAPLTYVLAKVTWRPYIISGHGTYSVRPLDIKQQKRLFGQALRSAAKVIFVSRFTQHEVLRRIKLKNTSVIPSGVNLKRFLEFHYSDEKKFDNNQPILLSVGAVKRRKGYTTSITAVEKVRETFGGVKYYIVGDLSDELAHHEVLALIEKANLSDNVFILGNVQENELLELFSIADLFILTPTNADGCFEGFGLVYLEANACGLPVIGTEGCGAEEPIIDGYNGFLVPQNNPEATAQAIQKLLENDKLRNEMRTNALERAKQMSFEKTVNGIYSIYSELLKR